MTTIIIKIEEEKRGIQTSFEVLNSEQTDLELARAYHTLAKLCPEDEVVKYISDSLITI